MAFPVENTNGDILDIFVLRSAQRCLFPAVQYRQRPSRRFDSDLSIDRRRAEQRTGFGHCDSRYALLPPLAHVVFPSRGSSAICTSSPVLLPTTMPRLIGFLKLFAAADDRSLYRYRAESASCFGSRLTAGQRRPSHQPAGEGAAASVTLTSSGARFYPSCSTMYPVISPPYHHQSISHQRPLDVQRTVMPSKPYPRDFTASPEYTLIYGLYNQANNHFPTTSRHFAIPDMPAAQRPISFACRCGFFARQPGLQQTAFYTESC